MSIGLKWAARVGAILAAVAIVLSIAYTPERIFELRTAAGRPVLRAYVGYYHATSVFNFVDSISRYHAGRLATPDADDRVRIPARWGFKGPLDSQPELLVSFIYVPELHNALQSGLGETERGSMTIADVSDDPERWEMSLRTLYSAVRQDLWPDDSGQRSRYAVTRAEVEPLVRAIELEYRALHRHHAKTPRTVNPGLDSESVWGPYLERVWAADVAKLQRDWTKLPQ